MIHAASHGTLFAFSCSFSPKGSFFAYLSLSFSFFTSSISSLTINLIIGYDTLLCPGRNQYMEANAMQTKRFPVIDLAATGENITRLRQARGLTVRDVQAYFGFEEPQAIYKWQRGKSLPTVDNLYALSDLLQVPMNDILVPAEPQSEHMDRSQQAEACCSAFHGMETGSFRYDRSPRSLRHLPLSPDLRACLKKDTRIRVKGKIPMTSWGLMYEMIWLAANRIMEM